MYLEPTAVSFTSRQEIGENLTLCKDVLIKVNLAVTYVETVQPIKVRSRGETG